MSRRSAFVVILIGSLLIPAATLGARDDVPSQAWRTSWTEFAQAVEAFATTTRDMPRAAFEGIRTGIILPPDADIMRRFGGPVTFQGTFEGIDTRDLLDGRFAKLKIDMARPRWRWRVHVYPSAAAFPAWSAVGAGTPVTFRATVSGLARRSPDGVFEDNGFVVVLEDAAPVGSTQPARRVLSK